MGRRRKGLPISGWLNLDKPQDITSMDAVSRVRRVFGAAKAGHGGTLDPLATGVLPIAFGEATKTVAYVMDARKIYRFTVKWGEARDTDDAEGRVVETSLARPRQQEIEAALPSFIGEIQQRPPAYSAIKLSGERAYDLARRGEEVDLAPRPVTVFSLRLAAPPDPDQPDFCAFVVECGKGTYVRRLARDLGEKLGACAHVHALRRLKVGRFAVDDAIPLDKLEELGDSARPEDFLLPIETALDDIPALAVIEPEALRLRSGQAVRVPSTRQGVVRVMSDDRLIALGDLKDGEVRPLRVFNA